MGYLGLNESDVFDWKIETGDGALYQVRSRIEGLRTDANDRPIMIMLATPQFALPTRWIPWERVIWFERVPPKDRRSR